MERIRYSLELLEPLGATLSRHQLDCGRWRIGRGAECDVQLDARGVSREHVEIEVLGDGGCVLRDLGSTNGSRVDGRRFLELASRGDFVLDLGSARLRFREHGDEPSGFAFRTGATDPTLAPQAPAADTQQLTLATRLRDALWQEFAAARGPFDAALPRVLASFAQALALDALRITDRDGHVRAVCGIDTELALVVEHGGWRVLADVAGTARHRALAAVLPPLLDLLPEPEPALAAAEAQFDPPGVPSRNDELLRRLRALQRVARSRVNVLVFGETGCGKDALARWVHDTSPRRKGPYVAINCAALPRDLLEAELFGIERGAATGVDARPGVFERAHGGTLFLDELGDMPPETQVRLLRAAEEGRILRIGGKHLVDIDVRLVGATHRDLAAEVEAAHFRLDLYHRLAGFEVRVPPLRERREDIAPLAIHFFQRALAENRLRSPGMSAAALATLQAWHWPGNVRELRQVVETATAMLHAGEALDRGHLPERLRTVALADIAAATSMDIAAGESTSLEAVVRRAECEALRKALAHHGHGEAAWRALGIGKTSFYKKLREHGLGRDEAGDA
ncbi:MAG TPA: sigma 54-interacting transcriptional regulator [Patescibacteria group bacterium]|nr:sigma 54-interacting transcriptional regulator [Patescibacteria group bacterium]